MNRIVKAAVSYSILATCKAQSRYSRFDKAQHGISLKRQEAGSTLAEFVISAPIVLIIGMTTVQAGLVYHGKTLLNYATFEAARSGSTNNAQLSVMRRELGLRLAPLEGGNGTMESAMLAIAKSSAAVLDVTRTKVKVLNPTTSAFDDWGVDSPEFSRRVLPNSHLRHREYAIGSESGLSLRDANLLKIEVTHGVELKVPFVNTMISRAMLLVDPDNAGYYLRNQFPLKSVATVRMQSEAWEDEIVAANLVTSTEPAEYVPDEQSDASTAVQEVKEGPDSQANEQSNELSGALEEGQTAESQDAQFANECSQGVYGLESSTVLIDIDDYNNLNECPSTAVESDYGNGPSDDFLSNCG